MSTPYESPVEAAVATESPAQLSKYGVLAFLCSLAFILYLDRVCIGKAVNPICNDLGLSLGQMGYVLGAFVVAYGLFEVPTGHWGDRYGSRGVLTRIVLWWSVFTILTGAAMGFWMLIGTRFLFGAGEAGAYPNVARVLARWFPAHQRASAQGLVITSAQFGGAASPAFAAYLIEYAGWRSAFAIFGSLGIVWAAAFYYWFRDEPPRAEATGEAEPTPDVEDRAPPSEPDAHPPIPWSLVLTSANIWLLGLINTCASFVSYMFMQWYPTYLEQARGASAIEAGWYASMVLGGGAVGALCGGFVVDWLVRTGGNRRWAYSGYGAAALGFAAVAMLISVLSESLTVSSLFATLACMTSLSHQASWWSITTEISGKHLGALFGLMNSMGVPGALISTTFLGHFVDWMAARGFIGREQWDPAFYIYAGVLLLGGCCYLAVNCRRSAVEPVA
ncbi:MAG TPA: MFS transporter [Pirellulales bacterium]|nr:MFS transporter [Pirellulales bacterium]